MQDDTFDLNQGALTLSNINPEPNFTFMADGIWLIEISKTGIKFNREAFPDSTPDDFAEAFMRILENNIPMKFE